MIIHAFSDYTPANPETRRRMDLARRTWATQNWQEAGVTDDRCRLFRDAFGGVPYLRDILEAVTLNAQPDDIVVFTNSDICVRSNCAEMIALRLQQIDATFCYRRDFNHLDAPLPDAAITQGSLYPGSDLKAFRVRWWRTVRPDFPDMLLAREAWDSVFRTLIEAFHLNANCESRDLIYHQRHGSTWEDPRNRYAIPSQLHNLTLARAWFRAHGIDHRKFGIP